jgi:hypothetical protein
MSGARENEPPVPAYRWVKRPDPERYDSTAGCYGCAFRHMPEIRCSRIPCQRHPYHVAKLVEVRHA